MKIFSWQDAVEGKIDAEILEKGTALTVGVFDGIHIGHKALLNAVLGGKEKGYACGVVTFTDKIFALSKASVNPIESLEKRLSHFDQMGFDFVILIDFTKNVADMEGKVFLDVLYEKCGLKHLVEGDDFRFGAGGRTGRNEIEVFCSERGLSCTIVQPVLFKGERVSSTLIRKLLKEGREEEASRLMEKA